MKQNMMLYHEAKVELARLSRDTKQAQLYRMREEAINERRNFFLETLDKGLKEGIERGIEPGIHKGEKNKAMQIAKSLLDILDIETISIKTCLSVEDIRLLK